MASSSPFSLLQQRNATNFVVYKNCVVKYLGSGHTPNSRRDTNVLGRRYYNPSASITHKQTFDLYASPSLSSVTDTSGCAT
ncbi:hypothetical protein CLOM_g16477 [Closterium sp. NIES-68]|nr:hypothetical protein CLOM_g16477 [Closterium sp. NIES-68]